MSILEAEGILILVSVLPGLRVARGSRASDCQSKCQATMALELSKAKGFFEIEAAK